MTQVPVKRTNTEFDYNTSWQYETVRTQFVDQRFALLIGQRFRSTETKSINDLFDLAATAGEIRTILVHPFPDSTFYFVSCIRLFQHLSNEESLRTFRKKLGRYAPRYAIGKSFLNQIGRDTRLKIHATRWPQPWHSGTKIVLLNSVEL